MPRNNRRHVDHQLAVQVVVIPSLLNPQHLYPPPRVFAFLPHFGRWMAEVGRRLAPFGIARLLLPPPGPIPLGDSAAIERAAKLRALSLSTSHAVTMCDEMINIPRSDKQLEGCRLPPGLPLAVLSASRWEVGAELPPEDVPKALEVWKELQQELARQSTNSFHFVVPDCGHDIPTQRPQVIVEAIRAVVEAVRTGNQVPLPQEGEQVRRALWKFCGDGLVGSSPVHTSGTRERPDRRAEHHHHVYVVLLDCAVAGLRKVRAANPARDPAKPCVYVGMSGLTPEERLANHKRGDKAASVVKRYGIRLLPELYAHLNPMAFAHRLCG